MLSLTGWIYGLQALIYLVLSCSSGIIFIHLARKSNAKLLFYFGVYAIFTGLWQLSATLDFLIILVTGKTWQIGNYPNLYFFFLAWIWPFLAGLILLYIILELLIPEKKWYAMSVYIISVITGFYFLLIDPDNNFRNVKVEGYLNEGYMVFGSPIFIVSVILMCSIVIFGGIGIFLKSLKSSGILKKKLRYLSIGNTLNILSIALGPVSGVAIFTFSYRIGLIATYWFLYIALREEPITPKKKPPKKEIEVEQSLFRLSKRPDHISEEEITYYKEQEICLVCKNRVGGFSVYICENCRALYCQTCAQALIQIENACWVCNSAIDKSKPVKLDKKEEEIRIDETIKTDTKPTNKKDLSSRLS